MCKPRPQGRAGENGRWPGVDLGTPRPGLLGGGAGDHDVPGAHPDRRQDPLPLHRRFDQYVWPYLEKDLAEGKLTLDQAQEIVDAFFLKLNCFYGAGPAKLVDTTGVGNTYQNTTVGGVDPDTGKDATNPVTYMVFESVGRLKLHDPTLGVPHQQGHPRQAVGVRFEHLQAGGRAAAVLQR